MSWAIFASSMVRSVSFDLSPHITLTPGPPALTTVRTRWGHSASEMSGPCPQAEHSLIMDVLVPSPSLTHHWVRSVAAARSSR